MPTFFELECCGEPVTMVVDENGVTFEGWNEEAELALIELGFEPSLCWIVADAIKRRKLDEELFKQAKAGNTPAVEVLLAANAHVGATDKDGWTPLHAAAWNNNGDVVRILLEAGADANATDTWGNAPSLLAARYGNTDTIGTILEDWIAEHPDD